MVFISLSSLSIVHFSWFCSFHIMTLRFGYRTPVFYISPYFVIRSHFLCGKPAMGLFGNSHLAWPEPVWGVLLGSWEAGCEWERTGGWDCQLPLWSPGLMATQQKGWRDGKKLSTDDTFWKLNPSICETNPAFQFHEPITFFPIEVILNQVFFHA